MEKENKTFRVDIKIKLLKLHFKGKYCQREKRMKEVVILFYFLAFWVHIPQSTSEQRVFLSFSTL